MVHAGCDFVAGIHPSRTWMSGSFESMQWNACVHRLGLSLYAHPKEFVGNGVKTHVNSKGKIPSTGGSEEGWTCDSASCRTENPTHSWLSYSSPDCNSTKNEEKEQISNNPYTPYVQGFFSVIADQRSWTFELLYATLQQNDCTSSRFPVTLWPWMNIKVIQTGIKM